MPAFDTALAILDWLGLVVFAVSGALVASRKEMDIVGFVLLGTATGIGGGTLRDLILDAPVFWTVEPGYLVACVVVSCLVFFTAHVPQSRYRVLLWFDAAGLAVFAVAGAEKALLLGADPSVAIMLGVATATFGGILRDVIGAEPSIALRREIYVTAALLASGGFVALTLVGVPREIAMGLSIAAGFSLRGAALAFGWTMPRYKARAGRSPDEIER
ncbi:trimeric intracellular cation channel family protein [Salinarimonas ramus]|uniref:Membrane protein n=1 Tax=Salinarimonas ramus TaxID=690164 RepID=A0A917QC20_9HYPH|nr:trimeric intracellular cation channel family protein [Salinarimonas ramus]GGK42354.1 membrane protein [Salinarimonas ramus]